MPILIKATSSLPSGKHRQSTGTAHIPTSKQQASLQSCSPAPRRALPRLCRVPTALQEALASPPGQGTSDKHDAAAGTLGRDGQGPSVRSVTASTLGHGSVPDRYVSPARCSRPTRLRGPQLLMAPWSLWAALRTCRNTGDGWPFQTSHPQTLQPWGLQRAGQLQ